MKCCLPGPGLSAGARPVQGEEGQAWSQAAAGDDLGWRGQAGPGSRAQVMVLVSPDLRPAAREGVGTPGARGGEGFGAGSHPSRQGCRAGAGRPRRFSCRGPPRRQRPLSGESHGPDASEACTGQGSPVADSRYPSCEPVVRPSSLQGPGPGTQDQVQKQVIQPPGDSPRGLARYFLFS